MELEGVVLVSPTAEVPVIEGDVVTAICTLAERGVGKKTIAREVGVALNTVRRYLRQPIGAGVQTRPAARRVRDEDRRMARELYEVAAGRNAVVVQRLLAARDVTVSVRTNECGLIATSARRSGRCGCGRCHAASSGCAAESRPMRSSMSIRCVTACRTAWCATRSTSSSMSRPSRSSMTRPVVATHVRSREPSPA
jgi:hypothetical protein